VGGTWTPLWIKVWRVDAMEKGYCAIEVNVLVMRRVRSAEETLLLSFVVRSLFQFLWLLRLVCSVTLVWIVAAFGSRPESSRGMLAVICH
jgi:hypothetical protein